MTSSAAAVQRLFFNQSVSVETLLGSGYSGDNYSPSVAVPCFIEDGYKLVRNNQGEEVVSSTTLYAQYGDSASFTPNSRVTVNTRVSTVISVMPRTGGAAGLPDHVEVHLT